MKRLLSYIFLTVALLIGSEFVAQPQVEAADVYVTTAGNRNYFVIEETIQGDSHRNSCKVKLVNRHTGNLMGIATIEFAHYKEWYFKDSVKWMQVSGVPEYRDILDYVLSHL